MIAFFLDIQDSKTVFKYEIRPEQRPVQLFTFRWEFIKEKKKVKKKENMLSSMIAIKKKNDNGQEKKKENTLSTEEK